MCVCIRVWVVVSLSEQAEKYADLAIRNDRYNALALVNKGNCLFVKSEFAKAKELYLEAIGPWRPGCVACTCAPYLSPSVCSCCAVDDP
jgi:hypothetical protein